MKKHIRTIFFIILIIFSAAKSYATEYPFQRVKYTVKPSTFNFRKISDQITAGANSKYEKARKIHEWIYRSFRYDNSQTVRSADQAMKHHKGVCQAICEVFYHLANAQGIKTEIICGMSENNTKNGHSWIIFVDDSGRKILVDPTWALDKDDERIANFFFDIDPRICILNHFPDFQDDQLLQMPILFDDYLEIQKHENVAKNTAMFLYGINEKVFDKILRKKFDFPLFYNTFANLITFKDIPLNQKLEIGKEYKITAKIDKEGATLCALLEDGNVKHSVKRISDGEVELRFTPLCDKPVLVCYEEDNMYSAIVKYETVTPTKEQLEEIERTEPYFTECLSSKIQIDTLALRKHGITAKQMLELCKQDKLGKVMPVFFENNSPEYTIKRIPMNMYLEKGKTYTFHLIVPIDKQIYIRDSNGKEYRNWLTLEDGSQSITISPSASGTLYVMQEINKNQVSSIIAYKVK